MVLSWLRSSQKQLFNLKWQGPTFCFISYKLVKPSDAMFKFLMCFCFVFVFYLSFFLKDEECHLSSIVGSHVDGFYQLSQL